MISISICNILLFILIVAGGITVTMYIHNIRRKREINSVGRYLDRLADRGARHDNVLIDNLQKYED